MPRDPVLAARQVAPARIGYEGDVIADVRDEFPGLVVIKTDAATGRFPVMHAILAHFVHTVPTVVRLGHVNRDPRRGRRTKKRHPFGTLGYGEVIGAQHQVVEEYLQSPVEHWHRGDIPFLPSGPPQPLVHFHVDKISPGRHVHPDPLHGSEMGTILKGLAERGFKAFITITLVGNHRTFEAGGVDLFQAGRHVRRPVVLEKAHFAAAMQLAAGFDLIGP